VDGFSAVTAAWRLALANVSQSITFGCNLTSLSVLNSSGWETEMTPSGRFKEKQMSNVSQ